MSDISQDASNDVEIQEISNFQAVDSNATSIWHFFMRATDGKSGKCTLCKGDKVIKASKGSLTGMTKHLNFKHKIDFGAIKKSGKFLFKNNLNIILLT
jgi:hypothetical protein